MYIFNYFYKIRNMLQKRKTDKNVVTDILFFVPAVRISHSVVYLVLIFNIFKFHSSQFSDMGWVLLHMNQHRFVSCPQFYVVKYRGSPSKHSQIPPFLPRCVRNDSTSVVSHHLRWLINNPGSDNNTPLTCTVPIDFRGLWLCMYTLCHPHVQTKILQRTCIKLQMSSHISLQHHFSIKCYLPPFEILSYNKTNQMH